MSAKRQHKGELHNCLITYYFASHRAYLHVLSREAHYRVLDGPLSLIAHPHELRSKTEEAATLSYLGGGGGGEKGGGNGKKTKWM